MKVTPAAASAAHRERFISRAIAHATRARTSPMSRTTNTANIDVTSEWLGGCKPTVRVGAGGRSLALRKVELAATDTGEEGAPLMLGEHVRWLDGVLGVAQAYGAVFQEADLHAVDGTGVAALLVDVG
jgi:hypothetical protein